MKRFGALGLARAGLAGFALALVVAADGPAPAQEAPAIPGPERGSTADHRRFAILQQPFASGEAVTAACLSCHTEAAGQVMGSIHWTLDFAHPTTGQTLGKRHLINSYCGAVASNEARCTSCHAGYGWESMAEGPPEAETAVDCLVCHDRSGQYAKLEDGAGRPPLAPVPAGALTITGAPAEAVDLTLAARSVGSVGRENCGSCHFYGGGGDNSKHGDLSSVLVAPPRSVDVHMSPEGRNFACSTCHVSRAHQWPGSRYAVRAGPQQQAHGGRRDVATCESCHGPRPHHDATVFAMKLNDHTDVVACQTCHIPSFARGGVATKTRWDWSTAGRLKDGRPFVEAGFVQGDGTRRPTYMSAMGTIEWGESIVPEYHWFDGQMVYTLAEDTIDPSRTVPINAFAGTPHDGVSRIWPFKRMPGRQAYDSGNRTLAATNLFGPAGETAFWTNFDWGRSIAAGMAAAGRPFSGEYAFVDTEMFWPITHMVAPAADALKCGACHAPGGRLAAVGGVRIPGAQPWNTVDRIGAGLVLATLAGVLLHALLRLFSARPRHD